MYLPMKLYGKTVAHAAHSNQPTGSWRHRHFLAWQLVLNRRFTCSAVGARLRICKGFVTGTTGVLRDRPCNRRLIH
jgi:hypothetical protein